jgi:hypothetical protein
MFTDVSILKEKIVDNILTVTISNNSPKALSVQQVALLLLSKNYNIGKIIDNPGRLKAGSTNTYSYFCISEPPLIEDAPLKKPVKKKTSKI